MKGFFIVTGESRKIDVRVVAPSGLIIYTIAKANSESFEIVTKEEGPHRFIFSNIKVGSSQTERRGH